MSVSDDANSRAGELLEKAAEAYQGGHYVVAETAFRDAAELYASVGNEQGRAAALTNLGATLAGAVARVTLLRSCGKQ